MSYIKAKEEKKNLKFEMKQRAALAIRISFSISLLDIMKAEASEYGQNDGDIEYHCSLQYIFRVS